MKKSEIFFGLGPSARRNRRLFPEFADYIWDEGVPAKEGITKGERKIALFRPFLQALDDRSIADDARFAHTLESRLVPFEVAFTWHLRHDPVNLLLGQLLHLMCLLRLQGCNTVTKQ